MFIVVPELSLECRGIADLAMVDAYIVFVAQWGTAFSGRLQATALVDWLSQMGERALQ